MCDLSSLDPLPPFLLPLSVPPAPPPNAEDIMEHFIFYYTPLQILQPNCYCCFIVIIIKIASGLSFFFHLLLCTVCSFTVVFDELCSPRLFLPQLPVRPTRFSATATCALTTPWCAMAFRTASTHGMKTTAKVIDSFSHRLLNEVVMVNLIFILSPPPSHLLPLQRRDRRDSSIRSPRPMGLSSVSPQA